MKFAGFSTHNVVQVKAAFILLHNQPRSLGVMNTSIMLILKLTLSAKIEKLTSIFALFQIRVLHVLVVSIMKGTSFSVVLVMIISRTVFLRCIQPVNSI